MRHPWHARAAAALIVGAALASPRAWAQADPRAEQAPDAVRLGQPAVDFSARRQALMEKLAPEKDARGSSGRTIVVLRGADTGDRNDYEEGRFRQTNDFAYLTGVDVPGAFLVLIPGERKDILYLPAGTLGNPIMNVERTVPAPGAETAKRLGFADVAGTDRLLADIFTALADPYRGPSWMRSGSVVYALTPNPPARNGSAEARFIRLLHEGAPSTEFKDLRPAIGELRKIKSPAELAILQKAIDITAEAQRSVAETLEPGVFEYQLEGKILAAFLDGGAMRPGFASIVGSGPNACIPHYFENNRQVQAGDLVVVDIGAEYQYYTADITRTFPATGVFTERQRALYQLVLDAQTYAAERFKPGETRLLEMTGWVRDFLRGSELRAKDREGNEQTMDHFFIHGLGHYLGLEVHDVGDGSKPMQSGEVFTIEPGLYIPRESIGIRIEDDYLVTETGLKKLSEGIPSTPEDVERWMAGKSRNFNGAVIKPAPAR